MTTRHEYIEKIKEKLDQWDGDIDEFEARAQQATEEFKYELEDQLNALRIQRDLARRKMSEIMDSSEEAWEDLKAGADEAWLNLKEGIEKAWSHFK